VSVEGVVTSDPLDKFWELVGSAISVDAADIKEQFSAEIEPQLFAGRLSEETIWQWLAQKFDLQDTRFWQDLLLERRYPLLGAHIIPRLASQSEVILLCGQRKEWFASLLEEEDLTYAATSVFYCSEMHSSKTDSALYSQLLRPPTMYIDKDKKALKLAEQSGMAVCYGDAELHWVEKCLQWLEKQGSRSGWKGLLLGR